MPNLKAGIVGLPNVGKSTLFNILTKAKVPAQNYPFCTIDPNVGIVTVEDQNLIEIDNIIKSEKIVPAVVEFVDIAGLVKGAHEGEGLGNQFLASIREVSVIVHVVRNFKDENVVHVENRINPIEDINTINLELILKDLETVNKNIDQVSRYAKTDKSLQIWLDQLIKIKEHLEAEKLAIDYNWIDEVIEKRRGLSLLTDKKVIFLVNTNQAISGELKEYLDDKVYLEIDLKTEEELMAMDEVERQLLVEELGLEQTGLDRLISVVYASLGLISFYTAGKKEIKAWTIPTGYTAPQAAGVIHTDFEKNFIAADVVNFRDFIDQSGWEGAKNVGKVRLEGRDYVVKEGDIIIFKHNS